jgi:hypothetical protein
VKFWVDVFTKYGKNNLVFTIVSFPKQYLEYFHFEREAETLGPVALDVLKRQKSREMQNRIAAALSSWHPERDQMVRLSARLRWL